VTSRLALYNEALQHLGERKIASLSENREPRRQLDTAWDAGAVGYCLARGLWNFAMRSSRFEYSTTIEPSFGYRRAFQKPSDFCRTAAVCDDEYFNHPLLQYTDEAGYWFADRDELYVRYVSDADGYGNNLALWPENFARFVAAYLAMKVCKGLTQSDSEFQTLYKLQNIYCNEAKATDAQAEPTAFLPQGNWSRARQGGAYRRDRGNRGSLVG
jgi:hypothetical protein